MKEVKFLATVARSTQIVSTVADVLGRKRAGHERLVKEER
jgi:hypothetical protein